VRFGSHAGTDTAAAGGDETGTRTTGTRGRATTVSRTARPSPEEFEAAQVERLQKLFAGRKAAAVTPVPADGTATDETGTDAPEGAAVETEPAAPQPNPGPGPRVLGLATAAGAAAQSEQDEQDLEDEQEASAGQQEPSPAQAGVLPRGADPAWFWNPFRGEDPAAYSMPDTLLNTEIAVLNALPDPLRPPVRELFEFVYRCSQMVPWVNVVVPLVEIVDVLPDLFSGTPAAKDAFQITVNELLLTTGIVSFFYYGYDQIADLLNLEYPAQQLKEWFYATAWDVIDFLHLFHNPGRSGLVWGIPA